MTGLSWFLRPNWNSSVKVTHDYKTDIISSRGSNEQRRAMRTTPRKTIEIQATALHVHDLAFFHRYLATWQPISLYVPELPLTVRPTTVVPSGETFFTADRPLPTWLIPGLIVMMSTPTDTFITTITTLDAGARGVNMATGPTIDFPAYARVCPMRLAYFPESTKLSRALLGVADGAITFEVEETSEDELTPPDAFFSFEGTEVFLETPDRATPIEEELTWAREIIDAGFGPTKRYSPGPRQMRGFRATFVRKGSTYALFLLDFFRRMKGMQGEFLMPTYEEDIFVAYPIAAGDNFLREGGTLLADSWVRGWPYAVIMIEVTNGTRYFRHVAEIHSVTDGLGTDSILTFSDETIADDIALVDIVRVSWVPTWRFASDQLTIEWRTDEVGLITMAFQTIGNIAGNAPAPPPPGGQRVVFIPPGTTSWPVPDDLDPGRPVAVQAIGAGSGGGAGLPGAFLFGASGYCGSGGAYSVLTGLALTHGAIIDVDVPFGGAGSTTPGDYAGAGGDAARFGIGLGPGATDLVFAEGGHLNIPGGRPEGGRASLSIPSAGAFSGGSGGYFDPSAIAAGGAGGAAGPNGDGGNGPDPVAGGVGGGGGGANGGSDGSTPVGGASRPGAVGGGAGGAGGSAGGPGSDGGYEHIWVETLTSAIAGPGSGAGGGGGGTGVADGGDGGEGGKYGGGGGGGGCGTVTTGFGKKGGDALIVVTYTAVG